jgi:iron complex outermembrane receptor protein
MNKFRFFIASILLMVPAMMFAQMRVSGTVTEVATGEPLPGVNIQIVGTTQGTTTDFDGNYILDNVSSESVLEFSYIGFKTQQATVTGSTLNVAMEEDAEALAEVVVIGYGTAKKEDLTGSVNMVTTKDFNEGAVVSAQQLISGKVAGVNVTLPSGAPGEGSSINIRGLSSLSLTNDPLYVIDGIPIDNENIGGSRNILDIVNTNDIESMVVLKDASATSIFGSRAANGVVMITTKKGKDSKFKFNYGAKASFYHIYKTIELMNAEEYTDLILNSGNDTAIGQLGTSETDWQKEIYRDAVGFDHDFSALGSLMNVPVRLSLNYSNQDGALKTDEFQRTTASLSISPSLLNEHLNFDINIRGTKINNKFAERGAIGNAVRFDPTHPVYDETTTGGYYTWVGNSTDASLAPQNPVAQLMFTDDKSLVQRFIGSVKMDYKLHFFPSIVGTLNLGMDKSNSDGSKTVSELLPSTDPSWNGSLYEYEGNRENKLLDTYLTYQNDSEKHNFKFMTGYSYQTLYQDNWDFDSEKLEELGADFAETIDKSREVLISLYSRLNYKFNDRFLLTGTLRGDASSKLNPDDRWGIFPSFAAAWNIHNESFMTNSKFDELKLRVGYGEVGNVNALRPYLYLTGYTVSQQNATYQFGNQYYNTYRPDAENKNIRWEVGRSTNIGLDFSLFDRRLSGTIDAYNKKTEDLIILTLQDPTINFANRVESNAGDMVNKGVELALTGDVVRNDMVDWSLSYNVSYNDNEVTYMPFIQEIGNIEGGVGTKLQRHVEGYAPYSYYVYQQVYDENDRPIEGVYVDRNGDGQITDKDKYFYKDPFADVTMGLNSALRIGNVDFGINTRASIGNYMYDNVASSKGTIYETLARDFLTNIHADYFDTGFERTDVTNFLSDHYVTDASFIKIDNITLGITFEDFLKKADVRVFGIVQNVATISKYKGIDPEIWGGIDNNFYPRPRTFTFGVNCNF